MVEVAPVVQQSEGSGEALAVREGVLWNEAGTGTSKYAASASSPFRLLALAIRETTERTVHLLKRR